MTQTIEVKYLGPTNTKGARLKATTTGGDSIIRPKRGNMDFKVQCSEVARELAEQMDWPYKKMHQGGMKTSEIFVFEY